MFLLCWCRYLNWPGRSDWSVLSWAARWKGRKASGAFGTWSALLRCTTSAMAAAVGGCGRRDPRSVAPGELWSEGATWESHMWANLGSAEYPGKGGLEGTRSPSVPLKFLRSFLAPLASLSPPSPFFGACSAALEWLSFAWEPAWPRAGSGC